MTTGREPVLISPRDAAFLGNMLRRLTHGPVFERTPQAVVNHGVDGFLIAVLPTAPRAEQQEWRPAHALHAAGDYDIGVSGADGLGRQHDRFQARAAYFVHRV